MEMEQMNKVVGDEEKERDVKVGMKRKLRYTELYIRWLTLILSLAAAIILGLDTQTKVVPITLVSTLPPINVPVTAKYHYLSAFTYFVVANAIACSYGGVSLILTLANKGRKNGCLAKAIIMLDLIMVAVLASANGAAAAVGYIGHEGNKHVRWNKVCNVFGRFCNQVLAAVGVSLLGSLLFIFLVMLAVLNVQNKH
ncbi:hypothetical protein POM88_053874 [Heracleum sosnowskyi]|uniref:CASP-like protein n=1 Tax=Heracleum sosnowskyi TaxID=360622 RepID=A0AAD8GPH8_9APIA|nr:hypothetical protein POM88_053874 [Heracleum sosnowskyi]